MMSIANVHRVDYSLQHAFQARHDFLLSVAAGEAAIDLAAAALHIAAEDDALGEALLYPHSHCFAVLRL
jgi:hypothetical protein